MTGEPSPAPAQEPLYVLSEYSITRNGPYRASLYLGDTRLRALDPTEAVAYAAELSRVTAIAEHDAAIVGQLTSTGLDRKTCALTLRHLRRDRRPVMESATNPIVYEPIVSGGDLRGRVNCTWQDRAWNWDVAAARQHLADVLEVTVGADLDTAYYQHLRSVVKLPEEQARGYVLTLRNHMPSVTHRPDVTPP